MYTVIAPNCFTLGCAISSFSDAKRVDDAQISRLLLLSKSNLLTSRAARLYQR